jgi:hypothetical protein
MSQQNVVAVQRAFEAWNADDLGAFLAELDPEVEVHLPSSQPLRAVKPPIGALNGMRKARDDYHGGLGNVSPLIFTRFTTSASRSWSSLIST